MTKNPPTQAAGTQFAMFKRANAVRSTTNPRKTFPADYLQELAVSVKASGVHQPLLLRPLPAWRVPDTPRNVTHEIVCGECRDRACEIGGVDEYPVMIKDLTDDQVLEIQIIENLQRRDLSELEEAEGYQCLMDHNKELKPEDVAEKIGKSRTYVYNRLKLLDLGTEGRAALREGKIEASVAMLAARIPDGKQQAKFLQEVLRGQGYDREPMSFRRAQQLAQDSYMLKLSDARFKITVVDLVPGVGSCKECSKRTGANPDIFHDVKSADVCTDPPCFHKKEEAAAKLLVKEAEAKGQTVIAGSEARELQVNNYKGGYKGYKRLDNKEDSPTGEPLRKLIGKLMDEKGIKPTMLEHPSKKGLLEACLPNDVANTLLKEIQAQAKADKKAAPAGVQDLLDEKASQEKARLDAKFHREVRAQIIAETWALIQANEGMDDGARVGLGHFNIEVHRMLARQAAHSLDSDAAAAVSKILDVGSVGASHGLAEMVKKDSLPDLLHLLFLMHNRSGEGFDLVTKAVHGNRLKEVTKRIEAEVKDRVYPKPEKKAPTANAPAAQAKAGAGGKSGTKGKPSTAPARAAKISAEEAKQGIADALQGIEGSASAPKGAVAPPAKPGGMNPMAAWPFPKTADEKASEALTSHKVQKAPTKAATLSVGQAVRVITDKAQLGPIAAKWAGRDGTIGKDMGDGVYSVKLKRGGAMPFDAGQLEVVA
ncbi:MAG: hypothetical protein A2Z93_14370 [Curvibacter sp. GWA2_64_110]|nr:MAG: hypothetical protein A2Z93_14370 [Curvibacter sp. GWA2_64_110]